MPQPELTFDQLCELFSYAPKGRPISSQEAAAICRVHPNTFDQYRLRGVGPRYFSPPGTRRVWYSELDVLRWLYSGAKRSTSEQAPRERHHRVKMRGSARKAERCHELRSRGAPAA